MYSSGEHTVSTVLAKSGMIHYVSGNVCGKPLQFRQAVIFAVTSYQLLTFHSTPPIGAFFYG